MATALLPHAIEQTPVPPRRLVLAMLQLLGPEGPIVAACLSPETRRRLAGSADLVHLDDPALQSAFGSLLEEVRRPAIDPLSDGDVAALIAANDMPAEPGRSPEPSPSLAVLRRLLPSVPLEIGAELLRRAPADEAPQLLKELPRERAAELLLSIAANRRLPKLQQAFVERVTRRMGSAAPAEHQSGPVKQAARLIASMGDAGEPVLAEIEAADRDRARAIAEYRLRLVDIPERLDETGMREVMRRCDRQDLLLVLRLLKSLDPGGFETLISMQSKRLAQQMREEIGEMDPQPRKALMEAHDRVIGHVLAMIDRGEIELREMTDGRQGGHEADELL